MQSPRARLFIERIAANVHRLRLRKGLTQEQLAEAGNIPTRAIQRIERATQDVTMTTMIAVADALGVHPSELLKPAKLKPAVRGRPKMKTGKRT